MGTEESRNGGIWEADRAFAAAIDTAEKKNMERHVSESEVPLANRRKCLIEAGS